MEYLVHFNPQIHKQFPQEAAEGYGDGFQTAEHRPKNQRNFNPTFSLSQSFVHYQGNRMNQ